MCSPAGQYPVMGESVVTVDELADYFNQSGYEYPSEELAKGGADSIEHSARFTVKKQRQKTSGQRLHLPRQ